MRVSTNREALKYVAKIDDKIAAETPFIND